MSLMRSLADNERPDSLANRLRRKRAELLQRELLGQSSPQRVLDVGGTENFWIQSGLSDVANIEVVLLNLEPEPITLPNFSSIVGDARDLSGFADNEFDFVVSNSVIEHVGDIDDQRRMAEHVRRVGKKFFVQTPARSFPIEPHFLFPFFAVLPEKIKVFLLTRFNLGWYQKLPTAEQAREFLRWFRLPAMKS